MANNTYLIVDLTELINLYSSDSKSFRSLINKLKTSLKDGEVLNIDNTKIETLNEFNKLIDTDFSKKILNLKHK